MDDFEIVGIGEVSVRWVPVNDIYAQMHRELPEVFKEDELGGKILNLASIKQDGKVIEIVGEFVDYRLFQLQRQNPEQIQTIRPVGVSGVTVVSEKGEEFLLFARRGKGVTQFAGFYELAPSGGLSDEFARQDGTVDFAGQLLAELMEECRISADMVEELSAFAVVLDKGENVYDICCRIVLSADRDGLGAGFWASGEYVELQWIAGQDLEAFLADNDGILVPTTGAIITAFRKRYY